MATFTRLMHKRLLVQSEAALGADSPRNRIYSSSQGLNTVEAQTKTQHTFLIIQRLELPTSTECFKANLLRA